MATPFFNNISGLDVEVSNAEEVETYSTKPSLGLEVVISKAEDVEIGILFRSNGVDVGMSKADVVLNWSVLFKPGELVVIIKSEEH